MERTRVGVSNLYADRGRIDANIALHNNRRSVSCRFRKTGEGKFNELMIAVADFFLKQVLGVQSVRLELMSLSTLFQKLAGTVRRNKSCLQLLGGWR